MSKYFVLAEDDIGPGGDIIFRAAVGGEGWYNLFLDTKRLGQVIKGHDNNWIGLSHANSSEFFGVRMIEGFANRMAAATFVIKHHGYWMRNEREERDLIEEAMEKMANKVEVSGIVTAQQINDSVGSMIQRSSRFR